MKPLAVVPTYITSDQTALLTGATLAGLIEEDCDIVVIDDCSPRADLLKQLIVASEPHDIEFVINSRNVGFAKTVNEGLNQALQEGRDAVLVNADIDFFEQGWLKPMRDCDAYVVGGQLLFANNLIQHAGIYYSILHRTFEHIYRMAPATLPEAQVQRTCPVTGALQYIRHESLALVGVYDENFAMGYEDVDYCIRVFESGRECKYEPRAKAVHHESMFRNQEISNQRFSDSWRYLHSKHAGKSFADYMPVMLGEE